MKIYKSISDLVDIEPSVVSIGKFDGTHLGHIAIFNQMIQVAQKKGLKTLVITFSNHPQIPDMDKKSRRINTGEEKRENLRRFGLDYLVELPFDEELQHIEGEDFLRDILIKKVNMKVMVCGTDCAFGYRKSGNLSLLESLKHELNYEYIVVEKMKDEKSREISSSLLRELLENGRMDEVNHLLNMKFSVRGVVEGGNSLGRSIGFPTANIFPCTSKILPKIGVYASKTKILHSNEVFFSLTNIGTNPSIKDDAKEHVLRVETYLYNFNQDLYGKEIEVYFLKYIRGEKSFSDLDSLKAQIQKDREDVAHFHNIHESFS